jgi:signal transduction histidine kinase
MEPSLYVGSAIVGAATAVAVAAAAPPAAVAGVAALAAALVLAHARLRARRALAVRKEQLAHTAHELRTPLTSVLTAIEMLRAGYATTAAETDEFLGEADLAARHLAFLVNDVLDDAALAAGRLRLEREVHAVHRLLGDALALLGVQAQRRGVTVTAPPIDPAIAVQADARRVLQVLFNLLGNAVKFSAAGEPIRLDVTATADAVRIAIVDNGPGVPRELRPRLFQPFGRGSNSNGSAGTGLGLHITKRLVEAMGGAIGYLPRPLRGSEFWFELPRAALPAPTIARDPAAAR